MSSARRARLGEQVAPVDHRPVRADRQVDLHRVAGLVGVALQQEADTRGARCRRRLRHGHREVDLRPARCPSQVNACSRRAL